MFHYPGLKINMINKEIKLIKLKDTSLWAKIID